MNPGSSVIDPRSYVTASAAGATRSIFDPRTVTTTFRCTARPSKTCAARIVTGAPACCAGRLVGPATKISHQARTPLALPLPPPRPLPPPLPPPPPPPRPPPPPPPTPPPPTPPPHPTPHPAP